uniref:GGDEF domain-containing protein n=1 Tax=Kitasatospora sp. NBC_01519 TaxID=2903576 RepID=UPI002F910103
MVAVRVPAAVRIEALREAVKRLLEANRRLRQRLAASDDRIRELTGERDELHAELAEARTDPVSGLAVRRAFTRHAAQLLRTTGLRYSLVLLDLDEFKPVNDRFGHAAGDAVLAAVGERIARWLGPEESAARLGGDEFVVLAVHDTRLPGRVRALRDAITAPVGHEGLTLRVGVSAGSARVADGLSRALGEADRAMYRAKGSGRRGRGAATPRDA